ncbi:MAG: PAS domain S-box protein [Deltaproteobacteria bacterium]|nr:PAS domain S-box protein [Deltaproteobacteria bacterium]
MTKKPTYKELEQKALGLEKKVSKLKQAESTMKESEQRYEEIFKHSLDCIYLHDFEGNFLDANPAALDLFGYTKEEITSLNFATLLDEDELLKAFNALNEIIETGVQNDFIEYKVKSKNGGYVYVESKGSLIYRKGKPYAIMGTARNITKRKQAEIELQQSEERYRSLVENTTDGYFICEIPSTKFIFLNQRACDIFGYTMQEGMELKVWVRNG